MSAALARPHYFEKEPTKEAQLEIEPSRRETFFESFEHPKEAFLNKLWNEHKDNFLSWFPTNPIRHQT